MVRLAFVAQAGLHGAEQHGRGKSSGEQTVITGGDSAHAFNPAFETLYYR
jgi:hypothetical protein